MTCWLNFMHFVYCSLKALGVSMQMHGVGTVCRVVSYWSRKTSRNHGWKS